MSHPETIDRFVIVRQVGIGGMGTVYEAIDPKIDRRVALKVLRRDMMTQNPELIERLWVEARAANSIRHPGVVQISEAGLLDDGTGFLVMEYLDGQTLTQRLRQAGGKLPMAHALQIAIQMASTLNAGHQKGIVHRDLKPDNVILVPDDAVTSGERIKLLDFGIAKIASTAAASAPLTLNDMGLGTPGYMAPEQMRDAVNASDRSDVYGLGAVLFELLSGRRPYVAPNAAELIVMVLSQEAPLLSSFVDASPPMLVSLLARMLQREPASARPSMVEVLRELVLLNGALTTQSPLRSGSFELVDLSGIGVGIGAGGAPVPPTIAGMRAGSLLDLSRRSGGLAVVYPDEGVLRTPAPSASTISQMTGQSNPPGLRPKARHSPWLVGGIALGLGMLSFGAAWWKLRGQPPAQQTISVERPMGNTPVPAAPPSLPPVMPAPIPEPPPTIAPLDPVDVVPVSDAKKPAETGTPVQLPPVRSVFPDASCVQGAGLSIADRRSIASVFVKAKVRLLPKEHILLFRQGSGLQVNSDSVPARIGAKQVDDITRMLRTAISKDRLPYNLQGVHVRCGTK